MAKIKEETDVMVETLVNIFTVETGNLKILLERKKEDPYKGYWILPGNILNNKVTLEETLEKTLTETIGTINIYFEQNHTFSNINRNPNERIIATSYVGLIDNKIKIKNSEEKELVWFKISELPKIGYDHKEIIETARELLKTRLANTTILQNLFPSDFTLPELQNVFENIMNIKLDRRNFRKKFLTLNLIEETGYNNLGGSGRPAKLYKFKENIKNINLF